MRNLRSHCSKKKKKKVIEETDEDQGDMTGDDECKNDEEGALKKGTKRKAESKHMSLRSGKLQKGQDNDSVPPRKGVKSAKTGRGMKK